MVNLPTEFVLAQSMQHRGCVRVRVRFDLRSSPTTGKAAYVPLRQKGATIDVPTIEDFWKMIDEIMLVASRYDTANGDLPRGRRSRERRVGAD